MYGITLMHLVRDETIHTWTTEGKTKNEIWKPFLSERRTDNFKDLEVAIQIWLSIKSVTVTRNSFWPGLTGPDPKCFQCGVTQP